MQGRPRWRVVSGGNEIGFFAASRLRAKSTGVESNRAHAKLSASHQHALGGGFTWTTALDLQLASGALLGTEQLNGGGSAALGLHVDDEGTDLRSAGIGVNGLLRRSLSVRFAYGWQLKQIDGRHRESGRGHLAANVSW